MERVVSLWLLPFLSGSILLILCISKFFNHENPIRLIDVIAWLLVFIIFIGVFIFLFFNHLPHAQNVQLIISETEVEIIKNSESVIINVADIESINEYNSGRLPWGGIRKWVFVTATGKYVISSLTISWTDLHRHFWNKIVDKGFGLPMI